MEVRINSLTRDDVENLYDLLTDAEFDVYELREALKSNSDYDYSDIRELVHKVRNDLNSLYDFLNSSDF